MATTDSTATGPLAGLRVLSLSDTLTAGHATQVLADFGAEVIQIERPGGSALRNAPSWPYFGRGRKSIVLDLRQPVDRDTARDLALTSDVLLETFRPGVAERLGLGYEEISTLNPRLVYASVTAFGRENPYSHLKGYEGVVMAKIGGFDQFATSVARTEPAFITFPYCAVSGAQLALHGILTALYEREGSGQGQRIDTTMMQGIGAHDPWMTLVRIIASRYPDAYKAAPSVNVERVVPMSWLAFGLLVGLSKDGRWMQFSHATPKLFAAFLRALGLGWTLDDPEWKDAPNSDDLDKRERFWEMMLEGVKSRTVAEWQQVFDEDTDVFAELFRKDTELLHHPQIVHDQQTVMVDDPQRGPVLMPGPIMKMSATPGSAVRPTPALDEHGAALRAGVQAAGKGTGAAGATGGSVDAPAGKLPLEGVTVVEFSTFYAAPFGTAIMADFGARVIKIEQLDGDPIRFQLPLPEVGGVRVTQGKQSVAVDINTVEGREIAYKIVAKADMVLRSFRGGVAERLGYGADDLHAINSDLVYHHAPGFGIDGPYGHRPAYAPTIGAGSGIARRNIGMGVPETADLTLDEIKRNSLKMSAGAMAVGHSDGLASLGVATAMLVGLYAKRCGQGGQTTMTTMLSTISHAMADDLFEHEGRARVATPDAGLHGLSALYRIYPAAEGYVFLAVCTEHEWEGLRVTLRTNPGGTHALDDPRFTTADGRATHDGALIESLTAVFSTKTADEWERVLTAAGVACVKVRTGQQTPAVFIDDDGMGRECDMLAEVEHPLFGKHARWDALVRFSRSGTQVGPGATIGQHTREVLIELGYSDPEIDDLIARKVIGVWG